MDTRHFVLQDWVERDLILLKRISTADNYSDAMTKPLARTLFYRHMDYIQGKYVPEYARKINEHFLSHENKTPVEMPMSETIHKLMYISHDLESPISRHDVSRRARNRGG